ncbi:MAG: pyridine nucleotide-disulfide oxidoreductase, partial [Deltaproteobacteria bacterium CG_4_10_14_3_um_filter_51_14]
PTAAGPNVRYVVPHKIDPETLAQDTITLQMRVIQPIEDPVQLLIRDGDTLIAKKRGRYARPGEMISLNLRGRDYDAVRGAKELKVSVLPV